MEMFLFVAVVRLVEAKKCNGRVCNLVTKFESGRRQNDTFLIMYMVEGSANVCTLALVFRRAHKILSVIEVENWSAQKTTLVNCCSFIMCYSLATYFSKVMELSLLSKRFLVD